MKNNLTEAEKRLLEKNQEYWGRRLEAILYKREQVALKGLNKELMKLYRQTDRKIKQRLEKLYIELIEADSVKLSSLYEKNRLEKLRKDIGKELYQLGKAENKAIESGLIEAYQLAYTDVAGELGLEFAKLNKQVMKEIVHTAWSGDDFSDLVWKNKDKLLKQLDKAVKDTVILGYSKDKAIKTIMKEMNKGFNDADRIVRTEVMQVLNTANKNVSIERGYKRIQHLAEMDERTCSICSKLNGEIFPIETYQATLHPRCRCTGLPVIEELADL